MVEILSCHDGGCGKDPPGDNIKDLGAAYESADKCEHLGEMQR